MKYRREGDRILTERRHNSPVLQQFIVKYRESFHRDENKRRKELRENG